MNEAGAPGPLPRHGPLSLVLLEKELDLVVEDQHHGRADSAPGVGAGALEEGGDPLLLHDLAKAVDGTLVGPLGHGLLGLHLEPAPDGVEGVGGVAGGNGHGLGNGELGGDADDAAVVLVGVLGAGRVVEPEVHAAVRDDAHHGHAEAVVEGEGPALLDGLGEAVAEAVEVALAGAHVRGQPGPGVVQGVHDAQGARAGEPTRGDVDGEELAKLLLGVRLREELLDRVLEGEVQGLRGEVAQDVGEVAAPEGAHALLGVHAGEAVADASVAGHLAGLDLGVGVLGLDDELHALDGGPSPDLILGLASWVWMMSFTRSMGAVQVLAIAPEVPPAAKSIRKPCMEDFSFAAAAANPCAGRAAPCAPTTALPGAR